MSDPAPFAAQAPEARPEDASHLQILSIFYFVFAGLNALSVLMIVGYAILMAAMVSSAPNESSADAAGVLGMMIGLCVLVIALSVLFGVLHYMTAQRLRQRRGAGFCKVIAALTCLSIPLGTILGVFTLIVLNRPSVQALFAGRR